MTKQEIIEKTNAFLIGTLDIDKSLITPDTELKRDLGMTSLDAVETAIFIKRTFGFQPERGAIKTLVTLQDLYDYIEKNS